MKAVLFDLDGTLLPMDQDAFTASYFSQLAKKLAPFGYQPQDLITAVWAGTAAMVKNAGEKTNEAVFWDQFGEILGPNILSAKNVIDDFYRNEFLLARSACGFSPEAAQAVKAVKEAGLQVILATNPIFPSVATENRIEWAGLNKEDFVLFTTYENSVHAKPNLDYYRDILAQTGLKAEDCIMVGNDVAEDMVAEVLGMQVFLVTDCLINKKERDISCYPQGSLQDFISWFSAMECC